MKTNFKLTQDELQLALKRLETKIETIHEQNKEYFNNKNTPNSIDYIFSPGIVDWTGFTVNDLPFFSFYPGLSEEIKNFVRQSFLDIVNEIINDRIT